MRGDGPPLVLIHGWAMHAGLFGGLLDRLAEHRTLHLVDLPGHGRSRDDGSPLALEPCVAAITPTSSSVTSASPNARSTIRFTSWRW